MATVSLIDPYSQQAEEIARRQRMAQALQESGSQVLQMPTTPGVAISPLAGLAKVLESGIGAYQEKKARDDYANLQNKYRTNYNNQLGEMARLISAPEVKGVAGQEATKDIPGWTRPLGLDTSVSGGIEMFEDVAPVPGQPAIAPVEARPAGYISAADLQKIDIPEVKQLAMARYLAQFEPNQVKLGPGESLYTQTGKGGPLTPLVTGTAKTETAALSPLGKLQSERAAIAKANPNDPRLTSYDSAIANETRNVAAERLAWEQKNQGYKQVTVKNKDGSESLMKMDNEGRVTPLIDMAGEAVVSAAPSKKVRVEVTNADGSTKMVLMDESDPKFVEGFATKGPEYASITTVNAQGETVVRQVKKDDPILATGYVKPLDGFLGQLQQAGVPMGTIRSDPKIRDLVDRYFVKTAGGVAPEEAAGFELRKAEVVARLGELGIAIPANIKGLSLSATQGVLGGSQSSNAAPVSAAPAIAKAPPKINDVVVNGDKKFRFKGGDPNQQSNWVEVK
jgi:hypothetical protein